MFQSSNFLNGKFRLTVNRPTELPVTFEVDPQKGISLLATALTGIALLGLGTLLFFRELEINRHLEERVLELKTNEKIAKLIVKAPSANSIAPVAKQVEAPAVIPEKRIEPVLAESAASTSVAARISDLHFSCTTGACDASVHLVPAATGTTNGSLVLVLETELPRIGTSSTAQSGQIERRVFHFYPEAPVQETFQKEELKQLAKKSFSFSRALTAKAHFQIDPVLKPLKLSVFVFDADANLVQMDERTIHANP